MGLILAILLGIGSYDWMLDYGHFSADISKSVGWVIGLAICVLGECYGPFIEYRSDVRKLKKQRKDIELAVLFEKQKITEKKKDEEFDFYR